MDDPLQDAPRSRVVPATWGCAACLREVRDAFRGVVEAARERTRSRGRQSRAPRRRDGRSCPRLAEERLAHGRVDVRRRELRRVQLDLRAVTIKVSGFANAVLHRRGGSRRRMPPTRIPAIRTPEGPRDDWRSPTRRSTRPPLRLLRARLRTPLSNPGSKRTSAQCSQDAHCHLGVVADDRVDAQVRRHLDPRGVIGRPRDDSGASRLAWSPHRGAEMSMWRARALARERREQGGTRALTYGRIAVAPARTSGAGQEMHEAP